MWLDIAISAILTVLTIAMAYLGVHVTLHPAGSPRASRWYKIGFCACAAGAVFLVTWQGIRNGDAQQKAAKANADLAAALTGISLATQETARIQSLNTQLQERLLTQSGTILGLSQDAIKTTTGGNSFCYMSFLDSVAPSTTYSVPVFFAVGKYPLYEVSARVGDLDKLFSLPSDTGAHALASGRLSENTIQIGSIAAGSVWMNESIKLGLDNFNKRSFNVFFTARNGFWHEALRMRLVGGRWLRAYRVWDEVHKEKVLINHVDKGYPLKEDGSVEW